MDQNRQKTGGRAKGTPNKVTKLVREVISQAADDLGGVDRIVKWAQEDPQNERVFWGTIYPKLLPLQLTGDEHSPLQVIVQRFSEEGK